MPTTPSPAPVDTKKARRRALRLDTLDQLLAEAQRLAAAEHAGKLQRTGNWTLGQCLGHIAGWANCGYLGFPPSVQSPPFFVRLVLRFMKNKFLNSGMPVGVRIPNVPGGTEFTEPLSTDEGLRRLREAVARLKAAPPTFPSPAFGTLTHDEAIKLNLRHAEVHLSFLHPA